MGTAEGVVVDGARILGAPGAEVTILGRGGA